MQTAADGRQALEAYGSFAPKLVVSDILMPHMNGLELARNLRTTHPGFKLLFMSGFFGSPSINRDMIERTQSIGMSHALQSPSGRRRCWTWFARPWPDISPGHTQN